MRKYILGIFAFFCSCMVLTNAEVFAFAGQLGDVNADESINASDASAILVHAVPCAFLCAVYDHQPYAYGLEEDFKELLDMDIKHTLYPCGQGAVHG